MTYLPEVIRGYNNEEVEALRYNKGILSGAPPQWDKSLIQTGINNFTCNPEHLDKESLLTLAGQLQRYGGEFYMQTAGVIRRWLYAHFELVRHNEDRG